jgi:hypothetical protein
MENDLKYIKHSRIPRNKQILFSIFDCTDFKYNQDNYFYYDNHNKILLNDKFNSLIKNYIKENKTTKTNASVKKFTLL